MQKQKLLVQQSEGEFVSYVYEVKTDVKVRAAAL